MTQPTAYACIARHLWGASSVRAYVRKHACSPKADVVLSKSGKFFSRYTTAPDCPMGTVMPCCSAIASTTATATTRLPVPDVADSPGSCKTQRQTKDRPRLNQHACELAWAGREHAARRRPLTMCDKPSDRQAGLKSSCVRTMDDNNTLCAAETVLNIFLSTTRGSLSSDAEAEKLPGCVRV